MKRVVLSTILPFAFVLAACGEQTAERAQAPVTANDVKKEAAEAKQAVANYAQQEQQEFVTNARAELARIEAQLVEWRAKAESAGADAKESMEAALDSLEKERQAAAKKLSELQASGAEKWQETKEGFQAMMDKLRQSYEKAKQAFA